MDAAGRYPPQIKFVIGNEGCERFSFYGMRSILTVYMAQWLLLPEHQAEASYHLFVMACYLMPLVGGWLADRHWGRYPVILWLSLGYVAGHATLAVWETRWGLLVGLGLIAIGSGGIKPCVSAFVGDQFQPDQHRLLERVYGLFYWIVNLGSFTSTLLVPVLLARFGPRVAFAVPGVLMVIALAVFVAGRGRYVRVPATGPNPHAFLRVIATALARRRVAGAARGAAGAGGGEGGDWLDAARGAHPEEAIAGARAVVRIMGVFAAVTAFWALFDQHGSSWVLQARRMDLVVGGRTLQASQLAALNPVMVLLLIPLFQRVLVPAVGRLGVKVTPLGKMSFGMALTVLSFVAAALLETALQGGARPGVLWQVPQYLFLTAGEVLVSVTGLEFSYTQAPRSMKSTIMSIWLLTVALGNLLTAWVSSVNRFQGAAYFWFFAALMLAGAVGFAVVARRYRPAHSAGSAAATGATAAAGG